MRYGVVSDIHANLHALDAVLEVLHRERVDAFLCLGDLVGYGPLPNECVDRLRGLDAVVVAGNHDLVASGRQGLERCGPLARETLRWTTRVIRADTHEYLTRLPLHRSPSPELVAAHGSLHDPWRYVAEPRSADRELRTLARERPQARLLLLGHTHAPQAFGGHSGGRSAVGDVALDTGERWLVNPGAVGQSREERPLARAVVLDLEAWRTSYVAVEYDIEAARAALRLAGLPQEAVHLPPPTAAARRGLGAIVRGRRRRPA